MGLTILLCKTVQAVPYCIILNFKMATKDLKFEIAKTESYAIYTTQPIEIGASCIEMSLISAANVANLVLNNNSIEKDEL